MVGPKTIFLIVCIANAAVAYNCIQKSCVYETCSDETECQANSTNGCMLSKIDGITIQGCSDIMCVPSFNNVTGTESTKDCCFTNKCNTISMTSTVADPNVDQCYSVNCGTEGCLQEVIERGTARICSRSPTGNCLFSKSDGDQYLESGICNEVKDSECFTGANYNIPDGTTTIYECCKQELCNDGIQEKQPGVDYCYAIRCENTGCIDEAIANNAYVYCPQTENGCMTSVSGGLYLLSCSKDTCFSSNSATSSVECCKGDLCNRPSATKSTTTVSSSATSSSISSSTTEKDTSGAETFRTSWFLMVSIVSVFPLF